MRNVISSGLVGRCLIKPIVVIDYFNNPYKGENRLGLFSLGYMVYWGFQYFLTHLWFQFTIMFVLMGPVHSDKANELEKFGEGL